MATSYNRRINLYINGKEVRNDIASIKGEMAKLVNQQARMTIGSKEYVAAAADIKKLKAILVQHQADLAKTSKGWLSLSKMADKFNKYQSLFLGFVGSFAGVVLSVKSAVNAYAEFEDKLADVMKTTGLTRDQVGSLNEELKKIDTRTSQQDLLDLARVAGKLGISAEKDILEFVRAADKIRVALSEDLGGDVEESINQIGKLVDIFKLQPQFGIEQSMLKVGSAINALGAAGTASEAYLVEFSKRVAGIAPGAGVSIEAVLGLGATLDELGQTSEVAATVYNQVMTGMFKDTKVYAGTAGMSVKEFTELLNKDANEAFIRVLEGANKSGKGFGELTKSLDKLGLDGARATGVLGVLAGNTEKLRQKQAFSNQEFEKGTSLLNEFNVKNNTAQAQLDKAKKKFAEISIELGKKLTPAFTAVISKARLMVEIISGVTSILIKYGGIILTAAASITAYTVATKIAVLWEARLNKEKGIGWVLTKLQIFWTTSLKGATLLAAAAQALFTGNLKKATQAMRLFSVAVKANPVGLIAAAVTAAIGGLILLARNFDKVSASQKMLNEVQITARQSIVEQTQKVEELIKVAENERIALDKRKEALIELNQISPEYFGNLDLEKIKTGEAERAANNYSESLLKNALILAARNKLIELGEQYIDKELSGANKQLSFWQKAEASFGYGKNYAAINQKRLSIEIQNSAKAQEEFNKQRSKLYKIINENSSTSSYEFGNESEGGPLESAQTETKKGDRKTIGDSIFEWDGKDWKFIKKIGNSTDDNKFDSSSTDAAQKALELSYQKQLFALKTYYQDRETLQKEYDARALALQIAYLQAQQELTPDESKKIDIQNQIVDAQNKYRESLKQAIPEIINNEKAGNKLNTRLLEQDKLMQLMSNNQQQAAAGLDELTAKQQRQTEVIGTISGTITNYISDAMSGTLDEYASFGDQLVLMALQVLKQMAPIWAAQIIGGSLATPQSVLTGGIAGIAQFTAMLAIMNGAIAIAEGAVKKKIEKKREKSEGYAEGGYTGAGPEDEPAGTVHKGEYVVPAWQVRAPYTWPILDELERARKNTTTVNPDLVRGRVAFQTGGYITKTSHAQQSSGTLSPNEKITTSGMSEETARELTDAIKKLTSWKPKVYTELIKKDLDTLESINKNSRM